MLEAGDTAPDFTLLDQDGEALTLSDLRGQTVVLYSPKTHDDQVLGLLAQATST